MKTDFLSRPLKVGDTVVMIAPSYRSLAKGVIIAETAKFFRVKYVNTWNYSKKDGMEFEILQSSEQLVLVPS